MGTLRIIAGTLRGRRIPVRPGGKIRPTPERVREALFSILATRVDGARVLDAYCGSGALGFEALSRGAGEVWFVDADPGAVVAVRGGAREMGLLERCRVVSGEVIDLLGRNALPGPWDLILADPPYSTDEHEILLARAGSELGGAGWIVLERESRQQEAHAPGLELFRGTRYGGTRLDFYRRHSSAPFEAKEEPC